MIVMGVVIGVIGFLLFKAALHHDSRSIFAIASGVSGTALLCLLTGIATVLGAGDPIVVGAGTTLFLTVLFATTLG